MRSNKSPGVWAILIFAIAVYVPAPLLCANASASQAKAEEQKNKPAARVQVKGKVVDRDKGGIASAEVTFAGTMAAKTTTDSKGSFSIEVLPGKYTVTAKSGAKSKSKPVEAGSDTPELTLILD